MEGENGMKFKEPLISGTIVRRYRRSLADVRLQNGKVVTVHSPGLGPMKGCYEPGKPVLLSDNQDAGRKNSLTWELISIDGVWIGVNPAVAKKVLVEAIESSSIPQLSDVEIQKETAYGLNKKSDLIVQGMEHNCFINIYSTGWVEKDVAFFPDAPARRATEELQDLSEIAAKGHRAIAFFLVLRGDCSALEFSEEIDGTFARTARAAMKSGVEVLAYKAIVSPEEISLGTQLVVH